MRAFVWMWMWVFAWARVSFLDRIPTDGKHEWFFPLSLSLLVQWCYTVPYEYDEGNVMCGGYGNFVRWWQIVPVHLFPTM